jgi:predicted HTH transcriptional regulator
MLRQVLGVSGSELSVETIERLIKNRVQESQHLDYKSEIPKAKRFAKDVAAMGNGGGGVIVIGVLDENNEAVKETPILLVNEASRLQQVFNSIIHPFINIHWHEVRKNHQDSNGFLVMEIPSAERVLFAVEEADSVLEFYVRSGQHRHPLSEARVEQMYRERFQRQSANFKRLD